MVWLKHTFTRLCINTALIFVCFAPCAIAQTDDEQTATTRTTDTADYSIPAELQTELPQVEARIATPREPQSSWLSDFFNMIAPLLKLIFWGGIALIVLLILYYLVREIYLASLRRTPKPKLEVADEVVHYQPDAETARVVLEDAERLARAGRFDEAVHTLLFRSIQDITDKRPRAISQALTSREIARLSILTPNAKSAFATIGRLVETSFFGGFGLGASDFEHAKTAYKNFAYEKFAR